MHSFDHVLAEARSGNGRAFEKLYRELSPRVHAFARARGARDPEGLVNEVFLNVFTRLAGFTGVEAQFNAWVFRIARNKLIDEARKRSRRPVEVSDAEAQVVHQPSRDDVEAAVEARLGTEAVLTRLDCLTESQRDVVLLRIVSDLTIESIAGILGKRPSAVKAVQRRAFRALARQESTEVVPL